MPDKWRLANFGEMLHKAAPVLGCKSLDSLYLGLTSHWNASTPIVIGGHDPNTLLSVQNSQFSDLGGIERMMALDTLTYLPDDILVKLIVLQWACHWKLACLSLITE